MSNQLFFQARARAPTAAITNAMGRAKEPRAVTIPAIAAFAKAKAAARAPPEPNNAAREPIAEATEPIITRSGPNTASIAPMATTVC